MLFDDEVPGVTPADGAAATDEAEKKHEGEAEVAPAEDAGAGI